MLSEEVKSRKSRQNQLWVVLKWLKGYGLYLRFFCMEKVCCVRHQVVEVSGVDGGHRAEWDVV